MQPMPATALVKIWALKSLRIGTSVKKLGLEELQYEEKRPDNRRQ